MPRQENASRGLHTEGAGGAGTQAPPLSDGLRLRDGCLESGKHLSACVVNSPFHFPQHDRVLQHIDVPDVTQAHPMVPTSAVVGSCRHCRYGAIAEVLIDLKTKNNRNITINTIGMGNYFHKAYGQFLKEIARQHNGEFIGR